MHIDDFEKRHIFLPICSKISEKKKNNPIIKNINKNENEIKYYEDSQF